jgi:hypothetical protein
MCKTIQYFGGGSYAPSGKLIKISDCVKWAQSNVEWSYKIYLLTMSTVLIKCLFLVVWFVHLDCQDYEDRPKLTTLNGHLILEAAKDKSIYLKVNGAKSGIYVQDMNLLHLSISDSGEEQQSGDSFEKYLSGPNGFLKRLERLENQATSPPASLVQNVTLLMRRVNRLSNRLATLQSQINNRLRDECQSAPCQNGGTCLNLQDGHHCLCPSNWEGRNCDVDVNECRNFAGTDRMEQRVSIDQDHMSVCAFRVGLEYIARGAPRIVLQETLKCVVMALVFLLLAEKASSAYAIKVGRKMPRELLA